MLQVAIFVAVTAGSLVALQQLPRVWRTDRGRSRRRLAREFDAPRDKSPDRLYKDLDALAPRVDPDAEPAAAGFGPLIAAFAAEQWLRLEDGLRQAGWLLTAGRFVRVAAGIALAAAVAGAWAGGWVGGLVAAGGALGATFGYMNVRRATRRQRFLKQLAGAFELMARVLRAGQSVSEAFRAVAATFDEPLSTEFAYCQHQIEMGLRPEDALRELGRRSPVMELQLFVIAVAVQRQSGGNLSEILDRLAALVNTRIRLRQKLRAVTAEGRLQSLTLLVLPPLTFGIMYFMNRQYAETLLGQPWLLAATVACMAVGTLWVRRIVNTEL